jgi:hypothetical protein
MANGLKTIGLYLCPEDGANFQAIEETAVIATNL